VQPIPPGRDRISASGRAPQALTGQFTLTCSTANLAHEQNKFASFPKSQVTGAFPTITPASMT
jgi:hypothetical protein